MQELTLGQNSSNASFPSLLVSSPKLLLLDDYNCKKQDRKRNAFDEVMIRSETLKRQDLKW
jgi:hypothetical protein